MLAKIIDLPSIKMMALAFIHNLSFSFLESDALGFECMFDKGRNCQCSYVVLNKSKSEYFLVFHKQHHRK